MVHTKGEAHASNLGTLEHAPVNSVRGYTLSTATCDRMLMQKGCSNRLCFVLSCVCRCVWLATPLVYQKKLGTQSFHIVCILGD